MKKPKSARFLDLVQKSGQPELVTLWRPPEQDRDFMKAVSENRVLTISQRNVGTKKDFGLVGFFPQKNASYLLFPRELDPETNTKVIGLRYEQITSGQPSGPVYQPKSPKTPPGVPLREKRETPGTKSKSKLENGVPSAPREKRFTAEVRWKAEITETLEVHASTAREARKRIEEKAITRKIDFRKCEPNITVKPPKQCA